MGNLSMMRTGPMGFVEVWEDGSAFKELGARRAALLAAREEVEVSASTQQRVSLAFLG
jgi:hypothetical protein